MLRTLREVEQLGHIMDRRWGCKDFKLTSIPPFASPSGTEDGGASGERTSNFSPQYLQRTILPLQEDFTFKRSRQLGQAAMNRAAVSVMGIDSPGGASGAEIGI